MALILNLETATKTCSVALADNGQLLSHRDLTTEKFSHAEKLNVFIQDVLNEADLSIGQLEAIAISSGPGSYTGLRIGASTAKGLCYALDIPMIAINSLKALASRANGEEGLICPMFDARRMEVYCALYKNDLSTVKPTKAIVVDPDFLSKELDQGVIQFIGPGAVKCQTIIQHENARFDPGIEVSAQGMMQLSYQKFLDNDFVDVAYFEPAYLKDFIAGTPKKLI